MDSRSRRKFDVLFEEVLAELPPPVQELIEKVPLHVDDHPSAEIMRQVGVRRRNELCGLYTGIPLGEKHQEHHFPRPDVVMIYREGVFAAAVDPFGHVTPESLRRQIHITVLHELAHHHGLSEEEIDRMGYG
ncbi:MAG: metallopeptidase family protein [Pirellulales bacterium]|nr:metallopeptidase family protein [Pirellulales bacterium]